ncbi:DUF2793 domain-containing protein [Maricaulis sp.]|uniref:DUF2793 domain-containing protein n=1 Tax=unclassified Maricaulis TaxID=2632371 RepID=UPI001B0878D9|nr:DUF2793 domain-containing protein [Maricaulis sp.]MBO6798440.1 DUF2793 domain-containing protein [Maricaulis sp.]
MSEQSPRLSLPLVMPDQAQKHVTVNESLLRLDTLVQLSVESRVLTAQPSSPVNGQAWILPAGASGTDWSAMSTASIALWRDGSWSEIIPQTGWQGWVIDEGTRCVFGDGHWTAAYETSERVLALGEMGALTKAVLLEEELGALAGASVQTTITIPDRAIVFGVSVRTISVINGATSFDCGIASETSKFGGSLGIAAGASNVGVIGPQAFYAETPVVLTANGGDFAGGTVRVAIHAVVPEAPD